MSHKINDTPDDIPVKLQEEAYDPKNQIRVKEVIPRKSPTRTTISITLSGMTLSKIERLAYERRMEIRQFVLDCIEKELFRNNQ